LNAPKVSPGAAALKAVLKVAKLEPDPSERLFPEIRFDSACRHNVAERDAMPGYSSPTDFAALGLGARRPRRAGASRRPPGRFIAARRSPISAVTRVVQAATRTPFALRYPAQPSPAKPRSSMAQVEGSGTVDPVGAKSGAAFESIESTIGGVLAE
jgi:hypothetical protein